MLKQLHHNIVLYIVMHVAVYFLSAVALQSNAKAQNPLDLLNSNSNEETDVQIDIDRLDSRWWSKFKQAENQESYQKHADDLLNSISGVINELKNELSRDFSAEDLKQQEQQLDLAYESLLNVIEALLKEDQKLRFSQAQTDKEVSLEKKASYTIDELFDVNKQAREALFLSNKNKQDIVQLEKKLTASRYTVDQLKLNYNALSNNKKQRFDTALEWVESQLRLALDVQKLDRMKLSSIAFLNNIERLTEHKKVLQKLLVFEGDAGKEQQKIQSIEKQLLQADQDIDALNLQLAKDFANDEIGYLSTEVAKLELAKALMLKSNLTLGKDQKQQIIMLSNSQNEEVKVSTKALRDTINRTESTINATEQSINNWQQLAQDNLLGITLGNLSLTSKKARQLDTTRRNTAQEMINSIRDIRALISDNQLILEVLKADLLKQEGGFNQTWNKIKTISAETWNAVSDGVNKPLFTINEKAITLMPLIQLIFIILIGYLVSKSITFLIRRYEKKHKIKNSSSLYLLHRLVHYVIIFIATMAGFSTLGINLGNITLIAGALSVGIGFGLQNLVSNFVSGLTIMFEKTLSVGDYIELEDGTTGLVKEIRTRSTRINTNDNIDVIIPNSDMVTNIVTNWTLKESIRRVKVPFGVAYGTDKELVKTAALEAASKVHTH